MLWPGPEQGVQFGRYEPVGTDALLQVDDVEVDVVPIVPVPVPVPVGFDECEMVPVLIGMEELVVVPVLRGTEPVPEEYGPECETEPLPLG